MKNDLFLAEIVIISEFLVQIQNQHSKIDPSAKFQPNCRKDKGAQVSTLNNTENCLMASAKFVMQFLDSLSQSTLYHHAKSGGNWTTNKGETWRQGY